AGLGARVDVVEMTDGLLPGADRDLVTPLGKRMAARCRDIWLNTRVDSVKANNKSLTVNFAGDDAPDARRYQMVLVAVGRRPNGHKIDADAVGIKVDERGFIAVDKQCRSNVNHIFAIGDVTGEPQLAHRASHMGKVAAEAAAGRRAAFDVRAIPSVVYTDPEVAWTGLTETQAKQQGIAFEAGSFPWAASGRALGMAVDDGLTKILFDAENGRVIGAGAVGPGAGELIAELGLAIELGADAEDIALTIHPHPSLSETVGMAAEAAAGTLTDLYLPRAKVKR
ncbi:MAG: FAD-dependent oxidoreductase, partial [Salinisphaera sp.]|nr:FAD-dependent oxidoreductase [Salinisphaera sp.]